MEEIEGTNRAAVESCHRVLNLLCRPQQQQEDHGYDRSLVSETREAVFRFKRVSTLLSKSVGHARFRRAKKLQTHLSQSLFLDPCHQRTELPPPQKPPVLRSGFHDLSLRPSDSLTLGTRSFVSSLSIDGSVAEGKSSFHLVGVPSSTDQNSQHSKRKCLMKGDEHGSIKCGSSSRCHCSKKRKHRVRRSIRVPAISNKVADIPPDDYSWRKYGQKPIKGSPYPRGYYKCSSMRGCPARKHVERCLEDPAMLIVTYEAEHNHPKLPSQTVTT
ncbi:unnamed protein product [Thlaspi arvense]|uniref:WRKY domain-containing protein n=1 Tax=Thlaspi arvense TaxID=13288 RepID=A0AAU9SB68_THLAR|nr:unnamed protein product [Thlaspi arvense]